MLVLHVFDNNGAEVDIRYVKVSLLVQLCTDVGEATAQDHYLCLFVFVEPFFYHII